MLDRNFRGKFLNEITPGDIERLKQKRKVAGLKNSSINHELAILKAIFNRAIASEDYAIHRNPVSKVKFCEKGPQRQRYLKPEEISRLMDAAESNLRSNWLPLFLTIALNTGMRKTEILSLRWVDVDFDKRQITVTSQRAKNKRERQVPMNDIVIAALSGVDKGRGYVFYNPATKSHIGDVKNPFRWARKKAGIKDLRIHDLRHSAASFLVNDCGISIAIASEILGHSSVEMTMRYVHSTPEHRQLGVDRLGDIFKKSRHNSRHVKSEVGFIDQDSPHINVY